MQKLVIWIALAMLGGCVAYGGGNASSGTASSATAQSQPAADPSVDANEYRIGPGDVIKVFVWNNPEISSQVPVRPDGKISTPLVEDMVAVGKTSSELARDIELTLSEYIRSPTVNVIVEKFVGTFGDKIRVVGQAANPQAIAYRENMTILDVMIEVGGLGEFASGNRAKIIRKDGTSTREIKVRLHDLLNKGEIEHNVPVYPGDVVMIPESFF